MVPCIPQRNHSLRILHTQHPSHSVMSESNISRHAIPHAFTMYRWDFIPYLASSLRRHILYLTSNQCRHILYLTVGQCRQILHLTGSQYRHILYLTGSQCTHILYLTRSQCMQKAFSIPKKSKVGCDLGIMEPGIIVRPWLFLLLKEGCGWNSYNLEHQRPTHLPTCCHDIDTMTGGTSVYLFRSHPKGLYHS